MEEEKKPEEKQIEVTNPIIIKMGTQKRKRIKGLMQGKGKLWVEVDGVIDEVAEELGDELDGKVIVPLVIVYRRGPKRRKGRRRLFGI